MRFHNGTGHRAPVSGVTLVEMIVVIAIIGIIAAAVAIFIRRPVEGYMDAARRAALTDEADTALRRMTRDLRAALPNSIRVDPTGRFIEYMHVSGGGRYRAEVDSAGNGDVLDFTTPDGSFDVIGPVPAVSTSDFIVIYNLSADPSAPNNAYVGDNRATGPSTAGATLSFTPPAPGGVASPFPFASPGRRFHVVQFPVTYGCNPATGELRRYWGYTIQSSQPVPPTGGSSALLATNVTDCSFTYATMGGATQRTGVVALNLQIGQSGETVRLFQQVHVSNVP